MASALREVLAKFGFDIEDTKLSAAIKKTDDFTSKVVGLAEKFAGGSVLGAVKDMISDLQAKAGEIRATAGQLGITAQEFQKLQYVSGASADTLSASFRVLQKNIAAAGGGAKGAAADMTTLGDSMEGVLNGKQAGETFKALGIDVKNASGEAKRPIEVFQEAAKAIASIADPSVRTATALKVFGRNGQALLPFFSKGAEEVDKLVAQFEELGGGLSDEAIAKLKDQGKAQKALGLATLSLKSSIAEELVPWFTRQIEAHAKVITWIGKTLKNTNALKAAILVIGAAMAWQGREALLAGAKTAIAYAPVALAVAGLVLLIDDLITTIDGGDSVIKRSGKSWLEWISGSQATAEVNQDVWDQFLKLVHDTSWTDIFGDALDYWTHDLTAWLDNLDIKMKAALFSMKDSAEQLGGDIVNGLIKGLDGAWEGLKNAVLRLGKGIKDTFANFFDAHSPSRVMRADVKTMIGGGVVEGLAASAEDIRTQAQETYANALLPSAQYAPTITVAGGGRGDTVQHNTVQSTHKIDIRVQGGGARDIASGVRDSLPQPLNDSRRATLAALEDLVDDQ